MKNCIVRFRGNGNTYFSKIVTIENQFVSLEAPVKCKSSAYCSSANINRNFEFYTVEPGIRLRLHGYHCTIHEYGDEAKLPSWLNQSYDDVQKIIQEFKKEQEEKEATKPKEKKGFFRK